MPLLECRVEPMVIPTYPDAEKERLMMYCENRIHQRTSGRVYPNPVTLRVNRDRKIDRTYTAVILENDFLELVILPEIGGRIFSARDKGNGYDFFYRQHVIKPALIGLLGSWISGGVEFNWPMHHRPSTFLPVDYTVDRSESDAVTVWLGELDPLDRMKGEVGIRLYRDRGYFETEVRIYNRTAFPQSFLWWENAAVPVHPEYRIFFPPDVHHVNFHYKRSVTAWPVPDSMFNGHDYRDRSIDLRRHGDTNAATSYFSARSKYDFFGGYDALRDAGVLHIADHNVSPGKKLFTWGYGQLARSWERALTDADGAYAELMAGSYSDNQPDFAWLEPYERKVFRQFWYPFRRIGVPDAATLRGALSVREGELHFFPTETGSGVIVQRHEDGVWRDDSILNVQTGVPVKLAPPPDSPVRILDAGRKLMTARIPEPETVTVRPPERSVAAAPPPEELNCAEELFLAGRHLSQYRDPITEPEAYWQRAIELVPSDWRSHNALGLAALKRGQFREAQICFQTAIAAQCRFNPNPREGEAYFNLGLALKFQGDDDAAREAFGKASWNFAWIAAAGFELAQLECRNGDFTAAAARLTPEITAAIPGALSLLGSIEARLGRREAAMRHAAAALAADPLDYQALNLRFELVGGPELFAMLSRSPGETVIDLGFEYRNAGMEEELQRLLARYERFYGSLNHPVLEYLAGRESRAALDYCCPSRPDELRLLAARADGRAAYLRGNLLAGKQRHREALEAWERALEAGETYYALYRNCAMEYFRLYHDCDKARSFMEHALVLCPDDPELLAEQNELLRLANVPAMERIAILERHPEALAQREDLFVELIRAKLELGECETALRLLQSRHFTPCEGGEHALAELWIFAHLRLGRLALRQGNAAAAADHFRQARQLPDSLGAGVWNDAMHVPAQYFEGVALEAAGQQSQASECFRAIVAMGTDSFTYQYLPGFDCWRALALTRLGKRREARKTAKARIAVWEREQQAPDHGYFRPTPFFRTFLEPAREARARHYGYLLGLAGLALEDYLAAKQYFIEVLNLHSGEIHAALELEFLPPLPDGTR